VYNKGMKRIFFPVLSILLVSFLISCVLYGSGITTISGDLSGVLQTAAVKVGVFEPDVYFYYNSYSSGEADEVFSDQDGYEYGGSTSTAYAPVVFVNPGTALEYSLILPDEPSTVTCIIAWIDDGDDLFDIATEKAWLSVKTINGSSQIVNFFTYIEEVEEITYLVNYSNLTYTEAHDDSFDAIGADGFNFVFD
jgi:hypothetical protein